MDHHVFKVLEFDRVCAFLESFAQSAGGRRLCLSTRPHTHPENVRKAQQQTTEMRSEIEDSGPLALGGVHDIRCDVQRTRIQNFHLDQQQLLRIAETLEIASTMQAYFTGLQEKTPALFQHTAPLIPLHDLIKRIRSCISVRGDILDNASEHLADLRRQIRSVRETIIRNLEKYLNDVDLSFAVQDDFITLRNNRFVIPVRSDRKAAIPGVVHDQSQSKATFFVEPLEILELNNSLQLSQREAAHEEIRILTELTWSVQQHESAIVTNLTILEELDAIHARAALSRAMAAQPPILSNAAAISLKNCRHPILSARFMPADIDHEPEQGNEITPGNWVFDRPGVVDIEIIKKPDINTLVITGANAGGKTVALKTLGLFVLMHQAGMHLPVSPEGHISIFESLFADIGDEQNIEASLSTFTAHMERIKAVVNAATPRSLVLLDELGSGTDPSEGGALAVAILEHLNALGCTTLVTSHLNVLKTYAHTHDGVENVSVEFDPHTHRPLYRLVYGLPGFSNALSIARNIGIPESILQTAGSYIGQADRQVADLVHALEDSQNLLHEKRMQLQALHEHRTDVLNASQRLLETLQNHRDRFLKKFEETARALLRQSENRLRSIIKEARQNLQQQPATHRNTDALKQLQQVKQDLYRYRADKTPAPAPLNHVDPGQKVTIISLKKTGTIVSVDAIARRAEIDIGSMRVKTGFNELTLAGPRTIKPNKPPLPPATFARPTESSFEKQLNVIGLRVAEALPLIDKCIDTALLQGADIVEIIHGRGTGRLMRAIHAHLQDHAQVARLIPNSDHPGSSSVTRVELK